jgi:hydroxylysine kinase
MPRIWEQLHEPFDPIPVSRAIALLKWHWELQPTSVEPIETERDDSFHVIAPDGEYLLKISHPGDDPHVIGMQSAAMRHASEAGLPVQLLVPTNDGSTHPVEHGRVVRLLTWIPGDLMLAHWPDDAQLVKVGEQLATLSSALASFEHPAAHRTLAFDVRAIGELRDLLYLAPTPSVGVALDEMEAALPEYEAMPGQVVHGDFHPGNVIVDERGEVSGILDFDDCLYAPRVLDLAIAVSYFAPREGDAEPAVAPFIEGWNRLLPLTPRERSLLPMLVGARLVQRILLGAAGAEGRADRLYGIARLGDTLDNWRRAQPTA